MSRERIRIRLKKRRGSLLLGSFLSSMPQMFQWCFCCSHECSPNKRVMIEGTGGGFWSSTASITGVPEEESGEEPLIQC